MSSTVKYVLCIIQLENFVLVGLKNVLICGLIVPCETSFYIGLVGTQKDVGYYIILLHEYWTNIPQYSFNTPFII